MKIKGMNFSLKNEMNQPVMGLSHSTWPQTSWSKSIFSKSPSCHIPSMNVGFIEHIKNTNQCVCHRRSPPTPWGIWVPPSLSGFTVHLQSDPTITSPYTETYSPRFTMHSILEPLGLTERKCTFWLYHISLHSSAKGFLGPSEHKSWLYYNPQCGSRVTRPVASCILSLA